jgi:sigma-54 dependent transcriptional regulator, flagellar regulatory protein
VFPIEMPSLRERRGDLPTLIDEFTTQNIAAGRGEFRFTPPALAALTQYAWPGNIRELGNLMERLCILHAGGTVDVADLPARYRPTELTDIEVLELLEPPQPVSAPCAPSRPEWCEPLAESADDVPSAASATPSGLVEPDGRLALPPDGMDLKACLHDLEFRLIGQALERSGGTVAQAARLLGLRRTTLVEKLRKFGFDAQEALSEI